MRLRFSREALTALTAAASVVVLMASTAAAIGTTPTRSSPGSSASNQSAACYRPASSAAGGARQETPKGMSQSPQFAAGLLMEGQETALVIGSKDLQEWVVACTGDPFSGTWSKVGEGTQRRLDEGFVVDTGKGGFPGGQFLRACISEAKSASDAVKVCGANTRCVDTPILPKATFSTRMLKGGRQIEFELANGPWREPASPAPIHLCVTAERNGLEHNIPTRPPGTSEPNTVSLDLPTQLGELAYNDRLTVTARDDFNDPLVLGQTTILQLIDDAQAVVGTATAIVHFHLPPGKASLAVTFRTPDTSHAASDDELESGRAVIALNRPLIEPSRPLMVEMAVADSSTHDFVAFDRASFPLLPASVRVDGPPKEGDTKVGGGASVGLQQVRVRVLTPSSSQSEGCSDRVESVAFEKLANGSFGHTLASPLVADQVVEACPVANQTSPPEVIKECDRVPVGCSDPPCGAKRRGGGEITQVVLGYEQVGASGTDDSQHYFFHFFTSRNLPFFGKHDDRNWGRPLRWWGDVRVASYPQQVNSSVAQFAEAFSANVGNLPVTQLAQTGVFVTGVEARIARTSCLKQSLTDATARTRVMLTAFAGGGASGPNNNSTTTVFSVPPSTTPQYNVLERVYPQAIPSPGSSPGTNSYVAFLPQTSHFWREWEVGFRLYSAFGVRDAQVSSGVPALIQLSIGQNERITGKRKDAVLHAAAVYPLALGDRTKADTLIVYLFGEAFVGLGTGGASSPLQLTPAQDSKGNPVPLSDPNVTIILGSPNATDIYRIGLGIDLIPVVKKLIAPSPTAAHKGS